MGIQNKLKPFKGNQVKQYYNLTEQNCRKMEHELIAVIKRNVQQKLCNTIPHLEHSIHAKNRRTNLSANKSLILLQIT